MDTDKEHYRAFLKLCEESGITVWADRNLQTSKGTTGHWNGGDHISVSRPSLDRDSLALIPGRTTDAKLTQFIDGSPKIRWEMAILLHEYGHWKSGRRHLSNADGQTLYRQEEEAWEIGRQAGFDCGVRDFSVFDSEREKALKGYRKGFGVE